MTATLILESLLTMSSKQIIHTNTTDYIVFRLTYLRHECTVDSSGWTVTYELNIQLDGFNIRYDREFRPRTKQLLDLLNATRART